MSSRQKIWIYLCLVGSLYHLLRDILQTLHIDTWISDIILKPGPHPDGLLWNPLNTVIIELVTIVLCAIILRRKQFGKLGWTTIFITVSTILGFCYYWFFL